MTGICLISSMESEQEHRKSSVETEMENYLKSELGAEVGSVVPDLVKSTSQDSTEESLHTASENLVTSAIISVDDMDSGDYNEVADDEKKAAPALHSHASSDPRFQDCRDEEEVLLCSLHVAVDS